MRISDATFEKHDYAKPIKRKISPVENFDPRPEKFRGVASSRLPELLQKLKGEQLCISLLFDEHFQVASSSQPDDKNLPSISDLKNTIQEFKKSLEVTQQMSREIERNTLYSLFLHAYSICGSWSGEVFRLYNAQHQTVRRSAWFVC